MADALVMFDLDDRLVFCNEQYRALFPKTADLRHPGARFQDILRASIERGEQVGVAPEDAEAWIERTCASLRVVGEADIELGDGRWLHTRVRPTADGASLSLISDITREKMAERTLSELNARLAELARTDGLTGLANRRAFDEMLDREFKRSVRTRPRSACSSSTSTISRPSMTPTGTWQATIVCARWRVPSGKA